MGTQLPLPKKGRAPQFSAHVYCGQTAGWTKMEVGLGPGHIVLDGDPAPPTQKGQRPTILAHFCCGQTAGCIKIPLGMEVGLSPGHIVLDGDPASPQKKEHPHFSVPVCRGQMAGWNATWYGGRPQPRRHCARWGPSSSSPKWAQPPIFGQCPLWPKGWINEDAT